MKVYAQERKDGLDKLLIQSSIAYLIHPEVTVPTTELDILWKSEASEIDDKMDLFYMTSILASVGWNANDDVFDRIYTWRARNSASHKPVNFMHNETDIIGHMVQCAVLNSEGKVIADVQDENNIPEQYDIAVGSYLYKKYENPEAQTRIDKLIAEIKEGKWCVSMECLFADFDYAIITPNGEHKIVARNEESAFLTKHLRVYGGTGEFSGNKIGRLLKDFTFSGKGIVDNPANKRSIIFQDNQIFNGTTASIKTLTKGKKNMDELEKLQKELADLKAENKALADKNRKDADEAHAAQVEKLQAQIDELTQLNETAKSNEATIATLKEEVKSKTEAITALETELSNLKAEITKTTRLSKLAQAGLTGEDADKLVVTFSSVSEEIFDAFVTVQAAKKKAEDEMKAKCQELETDNAGSQTADAANLDNLETVAETTTNVAPEVNSEEELITKASAWFSNFFNTNEKTGE